MATEYFIVKPSTKQTFYLGKRIPHLEGLCDWCNTKEARYTEWECFEDVVFDLQQNSKEFLSAWPETTIGQIWDFCYAIYEFCDDKVYMDNDCNDKNTNTWKDWECIDKFEEIFELSELDKWRELFILIPKEYWVETVENDINIVHEFETVLNYIKKKEGK